MEQKEVRPRAFWLLAMVAGLLAVWLLLGCAKPGQSVACLGKGEVRTVIPVGRTVGIKLFSRGVMVVGLSDVATDCGSKSPARECGLKTGDIITHIDGAQVNSIEEVQDLLQSARGAEQELTLSRNGRHMEAQTAAVQCMTDGSYRLGAWIRDSMAGIGTVTYYDPATGTFACLGHGINDIDTQLLMPLQAGAVMGSTVVEVERGVKGDPGELHGRFVLDRDLGSLNANTNCGVFGTAAPGVFEGTPVEVAPAGAVKTGKATILANVDGDRVEEFEVEILRVYRLSGQDSRSMMLRVTDAELLARTGGIVQGMSGSPILQNGRLVGAVTHVLVNDPTCGYGIFAETMLDAAS